MGSHHIAISGPDEDGQFGFRCSCDDAADGYRSAEVASGEADEHVAESCGCSDGWFTETYEDARGNEHDMDVRCLNEQCRWSA